MTERLAERDVLARQASRLAPLRERLLRQVLPAMRGPTLDLACGHGSLTAELVSRVGGPVFALDADAARLRDVDPRANRIAARAERLPFRDDAFDLVVTQAAWLWLAEPARVAAEAHRVLAPDGALLAFGEPDFGGAIEAPAAAALAPTWERVLARAGADPRAARRVPGWLRAAGFSRVDCEVFSRIAGPAEALAWRAEEAESLLALPLETADAAEVMAALAAARAAGDSLVAFVPWLGCVAWK